MGKGFSKLIIKLKKPTRILLLGLDSAGKSTILYMMKFGEFVPTVPTIGFNVETLVYKNVRFDCWDATGQERFRTLWKNYFTSETKALIFVIDSCDRDRIFEAKEELWRILNENCSKKVGVLLLCNKQDSTDAMNVQEIGELLNVKEMNQQFHVQPCVATTGTGLDEGFDWIVTHIK